MSSLIKRGKRWYWKYTKMANGQKDERKLSLGTNWKDVAQNFQKILDKKVDQGLIDPLDPNFDIEEALELKTKKENLPKTFKEASILWLATKKKLAKATYKTYEHRVNHFIEETNCSEKLVKTLNEELIEKYIFRDGISSITANSDARHLSVFFNYMLKKGWIDKNPVNSIDIPEGNVEYYKKMLRDHELTLLFETFDKHKSEYEKSSYSRDFQKQEWFKPMLATFYYGGFRLHEIAFSNKLDYSGLQLNNLIDNNEVIWIPPTKGRKERFVPISKHLKPILFDYIEFRNPASGEDYIFAHTNGYYKDKPVTGEAFRNAFNEYCKKAKIPKSRTPHGLRHQRITNWIQDGFSMKDAAEMSGHSTTKVTEKVYTHLAYNRLKDKMKRIEGEDEG
ncbi:tyrosine-type recombinase/integrase [Gracilimonas sediminicola]|uniref:tyrosine-type recombinase/integrase n=1 Tax=Gracilimonas sediminicola TaxID=2952158 RepID=UPI0038D44964